MQLTKKLKNILQTIISLIILAGAASCQKASVPSVGEAIQLAASTENYVTVVITLENIDNKSFLLSATFTPLASGLHLYSKDIPKTGVNGLGRPSLLELSTSSNIKAIGEIIESTPSQIPSFEPKELLVYPAGPITLSIPIRLPDGNKWINDQVLVTYMACNDQGCRPPIQEKVIPIQIPENNLIKP